MAHQTPQTSSDPELLRRLGWTIEWHLLFPKLFQYLDFGLVPGFRHVVVLFEPAFSQPRFDASRPIANLVSRDCIHDVFIQQQPIGKTAIAR